MSIERCTRCEQSVDTDDCTCEYINGHCLCEKCAMSFTITNACDRCGRGTTNAEDECGDFTCDSCLDDRAEAAWERLCEDFHDGGSTQFKSLLEQQAEAWRLK